MDAEITARLKIVADKNQIASEMRKAAQAAGASGTQRRGLDPLSGISAKRRAAINRDVAQAKMADYWARHAPPVIRPPKTPTGGRGGSGIPAGLSALGASGIPFITTLTRAAFTPVGAAAAAAAVSIMALRKAARDMAEAIERARRLYARQLQSGGLPSGFVAARSSLATVIGVSEEEVMQYGKAVEHLNSRLSAAINTFARTNGTLTETSWRLGIMRENVSAMWASFANEAAPAINLVADSISALAKIASRFASELFTIASKMPGVVGWAFKLAIGSKSLLGNQTAPQPSASAGRIGASPWERMGLVIGNASGQSSIMRVAANTAITNEILGKLLAKAESGMRSPMVTPSAAQP